MAIYVFGLSLVTCTDGVVKDECGTYTHFHAESPDDHGHEDEGCSPLCICTCCSGALVSRITYSFSGYAVTREQFIIPSHSIYSAEGPAIWQPPKLG